MQSREAEPHQTQEEKKYTHRYTQREGGAPNEKGRMSALTNTEQSWLIFNEKKAGCLHQQVLEKKQAELPQLCLEKVREKPGNQAFFFFNTREAAVELPHGAMLSSPKL